MRPSLLAALTLMNVGCGASLSEEDSQVVFAAVGTTISEVQTQATAGGGASGKDLTFDGDAGSWAISGDIVDGMTWTGTILVDGTGSMSQDTYEYSLSLDYQDVLVTAQDFTMNGSLDYDLSLQTAGAYSMDYSMVGDFDVDGSVSGSASFDFGCTFDGTTYANSCTGDINGYDVSTWSY